MHNTGGRADRETNKGISLSIYLVYSEEHSCDVSEPACDGATCPNQRQSFSMISPENPLLASPHPLTAHSSPSCADEPLT